MDDAIAHIIKGEKRFVRLLHRTGVASASYSAMMEYIETGGLDD